MPIHYEADADHVVLITIDRPEARNACDMEHFKLLREAWERFAADDQAWVAIVTGVGEAFFSGADLKKYVPEITKFQTEIAEKGLAEINGYRLDDGTRAVLRNWPLYKPVIAAVNGFCTAGGMEMLGGCDIRVACPEAKFAVMEPKRGLFAGGGTTVRLPRQIPWAQAMEFLLCADLVRAEPCPPDGPPQCRGRRVTDCSTPPASTRPHRRQRPSGRAGDEEERVAGPVLRRGSHHAVARRGARVASGGRRRCRRGGRRRRSSSASATSCGRRSRRSRGSPAPSFARRTPRRVRKRSPRSGRPSGRRGDAEDPRARERTVEPMNGNTPCIIGVAAHTWHPHEVGDVGAPEPLAMWEAVARAAAADAGRPGLLELLDSIQVVYCQTCQYDDAVARLADRIGADPRHRHYSGIGGTTTQQLVGTTGRRMLDGELDLALITSAEALATAACVQEARRSVPLLVPSRAQAAVSLGGPSESDRGRARSVPGVAHVRGVRQRAPCPPRRRARRVPRRSIGEMLAPIDATAAANPHAWFRTARTCGGHRRGNE